jgi:hypothetical protein
MLLMPFAWWSAVGGAGCLAARGAVPGLCKKVDNELGIK